MATTIPFSIDSQQSIKATRLQHGYLRCSMHAAACLLSASPSSVSTSARSSVTVDMSAERPNMRRPSVRRRVWDAISILLCRPTLRLSPLQSTSGLPPEPVPCSIPTPGSTPFTAVVEGAQEYPGEQSEEGSVVKGLSLSQAPESVAVLAQKGTDTALDPAYAQSISAHEGADTEFPTSTPTPRPPMEAPTPANSSSVDAHVSFHAQATCPQDLAPGDTRNHPAHPSDILSSASPLAANQFPPHVEANDTLQGYCDEGVRLASRYESTGHLDDLNASIVTFQKAIGIAPESHSALPALLNDLGSSFESRFERTGDIADIMEAITAQQRAVQITPEGHVGLPAMLGKLGYSLQKRFERTKDMTDIAEAITAQQMSVQLTPEDHPALPARLTNLGISLQKLFKCTGEITNIAAAIAAQQKAIQLTPESHTELPRRLTNLGNLFESRFKCTSDLTDIAEAITAQQMALQLTPEGHADLPTLLSNLGNSFQRRFDHTGDVAAITQAISAQQKAVQLTAEGHGDMARRLCSLGNSFQYRFRCSGELTDISEAITAQQTAVQLTSEGHADLPTLLSNLGSSFQIRFECTGDADDLSQAITVQQRAAGLIPEGHVYLPAVLNNLGNAFQSRFELTGNMTDIAEAITVLRKAVRLTPESHADLPRMLSNLGNALERRFERLGDLSDITQAVTSKQTAVQLTPKGHAALPGRLSVLGYSLQSRFERTGDMADISEAIAVNQKAVQLTPEGHAALPGRLSNLGSAFQSRFERTGDMTDVSEAISAKQAAVKLTPEGYADLPYKLSNLGYSLQSRFEHTVDMADIAQAITAQKTAMQLIPEGHPALPIMLSNLGNSFQRRFEHTGDMTDIAEAITANQTAIHLTPEGHAEMPRRLSSLGTAFQMRFERSGSMTDIAQAITFQQTAVQLSPEGDADLAGWLHNLGSALQKRFEHAKSNGNEEEGCLEDMDKSVNCFRAASKDGAGAPTMRLQCAVAWARLINRHNPESLDVLDAFEKAVDLFTLIAGLERTLHDRHGQLRSISGIALEAAAAASRLRCPHKAVEWLEQGRCIVWGQLNGLRAPVDELEKADSQLAQRLKDVAMQLESAGSTRTAMDPSMEISTKISLEEAARSHSALAREWEELLLAARNISGFETFLLPSTCSAILHGLPESGHIVIINCHEDRCDALALFRDVGQPLYIPLPDFSLAKANRYRRALQAVLRTNGIRVREDMDSCDKKLGGSHGRDMTQDWDDERVAAGDNAASGVLRSLWLEIARPILDMLGHSKYDSSANSVPPRIWWCPTGIMSFLPIHAAGIYDGADSVCLMDYVVSSYTPTVTAITDRVKSSKSPIDIGVLALFLTSQPKAPGAVEIPGTTKEVNEVFAKTLDKGMRALKCEGDDISVEDCRRYMGEFNHVHLACHASQNASNPLQSRFLLHKGELNLRSIIQMDLKNADLAFLSACQTSTGEEKLSDEAVHLAAGMLAAGYRRVVATMWSISDSQAPRVATDFYDYLWNNRVDETGNGFDGSLSAHALHHAVQELRRRLGKSEKDFLTWVPYVHFGY